VFSSVEDRIHPYIPSPRNSLKDRHRLLAMPSNILNSKTCDSRLGSLGIGAIHAAEMRQARNKNLARCCEARPSMWWRGWSWRTYQGSHVLARTPHGPTPQPPCQPPHFLPPELRITIAIMNFFYEELRLVHNYTSRESGSADLYPPRPLTQKTILHLITKP
jgi:hypothetical protein